MSTARITRPDLTTRGLPLIGGPTPAAPTRRRATKADEPPHWRDFAACVDQDLNLFFPMSTAGPAALRQAEAAKQVCQACPVQQSCLDWALDVGPEYGIFGGHTETERRVLRSRRSLSRQGRTAPTPFPHRSEQAVTEALEPR